MLFNLEELSLSTTTLHYKFNCTRTRTKLLKPNSSLNRYKFLTMTISQIKSSVHYILPAPIPKSDERFARQYRCGPPPEFPLASPRSGIVHHLSGPDRYALTRTLHRRSGSVGGATHRGIPPISFLAPYGFTRPLTRTHVRLLGPCYKTGRMGSPQADARSAQVPRHAKGARCHPQSR